MVCPAVRLSYFKSLVYGTVFPYLQTCCPGTRFVLAAQAARGYLVQID